MTSGIAGCSRASLLSAQGNLRIICLLARQGWARRLSKPIGADNCCLTNLPYRTVRIFRGHRCQTTSFCDSESYQADRLCSLTNDGVKSLLVTRVVITRQSSIFLAKCSGKQNRTRHLSTRCLSLMCLGIAFYPYGDL